MTPQRPINGPHADSADATFAGLTPELAARTAATLAVLNPPCTGALAHELARHAKFGGDSTIWAAANELFELSLELRSTEADLGEVWEDLDDLVDEAAGLGVLPRHLTVEFEFACLVVAAEAGGLQSGLSLVGDLNSPAGLFEALLAVLQVRVTRLARTRNLLPLDTLAAAIQMLTGRYGTSGTALTNTDSAAASASPSEPCSPVARTLRRGADGPESLT